MRITLTRTLHTTPTRGRRKRKRNLRRVSQEALELFEDCAVELLVACAWGTCVGARERAVVLDEVVLLEVLKREGAAGWGRGGLERCEKEAGCYFGGEVDGRGGLYEDLLGYYGVCVSRRVMGQARCDAVTWVFIPRAGRN